MRETKEREGEMVNGGIKTRETNQSIAEQNGMSEESNNF